MKNRKELIELLKEVQEQESENYEDWLDRLLDIVENDNQMKPLVTVFDIETMLEKRDLEEKREFLKGPKDFNAFWYKLNLYEDEILYEITSEDIEEKIKQLLEKQGVYINEIFYTHKEAINMFKCYIDLEGEILQKEGIEHPTQRQKQIYLTDYYEDMLEAVHNNGDCTIDDNVTFQFEGVDYD